MLIYEKPKEEEYFFNETPLNKFLKMNFNLSLKDYIYHFKIRTADNFKFMLIMQEKLILSESIDFLNFTNTLIYKSIDYLQVFIINSIR